MEYWAAQMQMVRHKENVAIALASTQYRAQLSDGDTLNKPYRSYLSDKAYTKGTDITVQDISSTNEYLTVDTSRVVPFYVDDIDKIENKWDTAAKFAQDSQRVLNNRLDQAILGEYSNATSTVYNDDVGGSGATTSVPVTTSNIQRLFSAASRKLTALDVRPDNRFAVVSPRLMETLKLYVGARETSFGDSVEANGKVGTRFGFELYQSNNCPYTATWTPANNPSDGDTVSIAGVTFTFETGTLDTAGMVNVGGSTAESIDNLVNCINNAGTVGTDYVQLTNANRKLLQKAGVVATDGTTTLTIVAYGDIIVASSDSNDPWSAQIQHILMGQKGATDLVLQKAPSVEFRMAEKRLGRYVYPWMLYGKKTFADMADALVDVVTNASTWA